MEDKVGYLSDLELFRDLDRVPDGTGTNDHDHKRAVRAVFLPA